jgi:hypothetical protein
MGSIARGAPRRYALEAIALNCPGACRDRLLKEESDQYHPRKKQPSVGGAGTYEGRKGEGKTPHVT